MFKTEVVATSRSFLSLGKERILRLIGLLRKTYSNDSDTYLIIYEIFLSKRDGVTTKGTSSQ